MAPHVANFLLGSFGIVAAVLLVGGSVMLRAQQNRHRFELAKRTLDAGRPLPTPEPLWRGLRRQARSMLAVGIGLIVVGVAAWLLGAGVTLPASAEAATRPVSTIQSTPSLFGPPAPPPPDPRRDAWHNAQERVAVGQTAVGCGIILTLLGVVRLGSAKEESAAASAAPTEIVPTEIV